MKPRPITILPDLIDRTKVAAHELDNAVARRFERMLITVAGGDASANDSSFSLGLLDGLIVSHQTHSPICQSDAGSRRAGWPLLIVIFCLEIPKRSGN